MKNKLIKSLSIIWMFSTFITTAQSWEHDQVEVNGLGIKIKLNQTDTIAREENEGKRDPEMLIGLTQVDSSRNDSYGVLVDSGSHVEFVLSSTNGPFVYSVFTQSESIAENVVVCGEGHSHSHILRRYQDEARTIKVSNDDQLLSTSTSTSETLEKMFCSIKVWPINQLDQSQSTKKGNFWRNGWIMGAAGGLVLGVAGTLLTTAFLVPAAAPILAPLGIVAIKKGLIMETVVIGTTASWILGSGATLVAGGAATTVIEKSMANEGLIHKGKVSNAQWNGGGITGWQLVDPENPQTFDITFYTRATSN